MKKEKIFLIISIILIVIVIAVIIAGILGSNKESNIDNLNNNQEENFSNANKVEISEDGETIKLLESKEYKDVVISNIEFQMLSDRDCELRATVSNETDRKIEMQNVKITVYDEAGNQLEIFGAQIDSIEPNDFTELYTIVRTKNASKIASIEIEEM